MIQLILRHYDQCHRLRKLHDGKIHLPRRPQRAQITTRRFLCLFSIFLGCSFGWAQTPTLVQAVWGPSSLNYNIAGWPGNPAYYYAIEFPEPTQPGNLLVCSAFGTGSSYSISDDESETWAKAG